MLSIDSSGEALALAQQNVARNGFDAERAAWLDADAFKTLRRLYDEGERFDLIVLDPPKFAPSREHVDRAARAYKDINLLALKLLRPGGLLLTYLVLRRDRRRAVPEDRRGRGGRRAGRRADPQAPRRGRRSPAADGFPGRRIPERPAVANRLIGHSWSSSVGGARAKAAPLDKYVSIIG